MTKVEIRPTIPDDISELTAGPIPWRIKGWTAVEDGKVIGIGGLTYLPDGGVAVFVHLTDQARKHRVLLHKTAKRFLAECGQDELVTIADPEIERSEPWLLRLGFIPEQHGPVKVYRWRK